MAGKLAKLWAEIKERGLKTSTNLELLNCPKDEVVAFFTLLFKPVKNPVLIAIYYYKDF